MEKKHICLIDYDMCDWGGIEQVIENLGNALTVDYKVSIVTLCTGFKKIYDGISCYTLIAKRARMREILLRGYFKLIHMLNSNHIDVVIVCGTCAGLILTLVRPFIKAKVIFADHNSIGGEWNNKAIRHMRYLNSKVADFTVTLTEQNTRDYIKYFKHPENKICTIYNWVDSSIFSYVRQYQHREKKIITVGRMEPQKGYDRLIEVAKKLLPRYPEWEWHLYGGGSLKNDIEKQICHYGLESQLIIKGESKKINEEYSKYSIFVLTSYYEGLPLVLLEAKINRLPLVSFDILTGPSEIIQDGVNGFLVKDGDIQMLADKIEELINSEMLRKSFSVAAYEGIDKFKKEKILAQWRNLIEKVLS